MERTTSMLLGALNYAAKDPAYIASDFDLVERYIDEVLSESAH